MGKRTKLREAQLHAANEAIAVRLRAHAPARTEPAFINRYREFGPLYRERLDPYLKYAVRPPQAWRCALRVRSPEQRFLELVRFTFATYAIPQHLMNAWTGAPACVWPADEAQRVPDFRLWSIIAGRGDSLYREGAHTFMTKKETHHFVSAPNEIGAAQRAFWYAFARAQTGDEAAAVRVARTKLVRFPVTDPFWKDAARFFARHQVTAHEMNDLIDYLSAARRADPGLSLKGRNPAMLRVRMLRWHDLLNEEVSGVRWTGHQRPNLQYETVFHGMPAIWRFRQIKSGGGLVQEGERMRHCVASYQENCRRGLVSIWTLTREWPAGTIKKCLTIEIDTAGCICQCRGLANRPPNAEEREVLRRWAADQDLWPLYE